MRTCEICDHVETQQRIHRPYKGGSTFDYISLALGTVGTTDLRWCTWCAERLRYRPWAS